MIFPTLRQGCLVWTRLAQQGGPAKSKCTPAQTSNASRFVDMFKWFSVGERRTLEQLIRLTLRPHRCVCPNRISVLAIAKAAVLFGTWAVRGEPLRPTTRVSKASYLLAAGLHGAESQCGLKTVWAVPLRGRTSGNDPFALISSTALPQSKALHVARCWLLAHCLV